MTRLYTEILGYADDPKINDILHTLRHADAVEYVTVSALDLSRRRLRATTDKGRPCAVALPRSETLAHGAVLELSETRAVVVQLETQPWLCFRATQVEGALQLGFLAGHHHWRVRMQNETLSVALDQPAENYLSRVQELIARGLIEVVDAGE